MAHWCVKHTLHPTLVQYAHDALNTYDVLSELSHTFAAVEIYNPEDPDYHQTCEVKSCKGDVFSSSFQCSILLGWKHFEDDTLSCQDGHRTVQSSVLSKEKQEERRPEDFFPGRR
ncbi:unnamed protein product [Acanthoscelides obtectus]|uniref:Uncharacterized protein n=1 Tax=Acanthoscelides obtectus TaxID=200917 RepID=A0A9P0L8J3_ACAOB|nr:unnamed protein product [Acanthoscelides obtectus]CAK1630542.1 hypothetical protein AOBTE_LOCUS6395 [Acanthoscelides obtectus]